MKNEMNYYQIDRAEWAKFGADFNPTIDPAKLAQLRSVNDRIDPVDVREVYVPLVDLVKRNLVVHENQQASLADFVGIENRPVPFILGIAGSVAVGKSTIARLLQQLLSAALPDKQVELMTTDGFLYPNAELKRRHLMEKKGFPESYDMSRLLNFINDVKNGLPARAPVYSHQIYDIVADEWFTVHQPDVLIVEGINTLQLPTNQRVYVSDFFDFSLYVDAPETLIRTWYLQRFSMLLDTAFKDPTNYYYPYTLGPREDALAMARGVWRKINHKNLHEFILPTRNRADLIIHKTHDHYVDRLYLRKY